MAIKTVLVDDFDGSPLPPSSTSTTFALNGVQYEIDLGPENLERLKEALAPFIKAARKVGSARGRAASAGAGRRATRGDLAAIRAWAAANGHKVGDRGRIPAEIVAAYEAANG